jgi:hypothetical protein
MSMQQIFFASHKTSGVSAAVIASQPWDTHLEGWQWDGGFGTRYSGATVSSGGGASGTNDSVAMSFNNTWAASAEASSPHIHVWAFDLGDGFGSKFSDPSALPGNPLNALAFSKSSAYLHGAGEGSSRTHVYPFSGSGFGTKVSDPSTVPTGTAFTSDWANDSADVAVGHQTSPNISVYPFTSSYGTKYSDPTTPPWQEAGTVKGVAFAADDASMLLAGFDYAPHSWGYPWSGSGFGTKYSAPSSAPTMSCNSADINYASNEAVLVQSTGHPDSSEVRIHAYAWSSASGCGTKRGDPSTVPPGIGKAVRFTHDDAYIIMGHATSPYISAWPYSASGFGTKLSNPTSLPAIECRSIDVTQDV